VTKIGICGEHCPREAVTNFEQIFLLSPLLVRGGLEGGQISNAEDEELHFNLYTKNAACQVRFYRHTAKFPDSVGVPDNETDVVNAACPAR
jgi:hypothetical protein